MKKIFTNLMKYFFVTKWVKSVSFLSFLILSGLISFAQTTYTWNQTGTASWAVGTNWTPTRIAPAVNDILVFDNAATTTPTNIPTETIGQLLISNNTVVNLQGAAAATVLTVSGLPGVDLSVSAGSALNINGANSTTITLSTTATGNITGNMAFSTALHRLDAVDAGAINFNSPAIFSQDAGCTGNVFTNAGNPNVVVFNTGTTFVQNAGANPFGLGQPASKVVFNAGSLFKMQQNAAPSFSGRTYANFEVNLGGFAQSPTGTSALTMDNLTVTLGTLNINLTVGGVNVKGNISVAAGQTLTFTPAIAGNILTFNGTAAQSITNAGTLTFGANEAVTLNNAAGLTINNNITLNNILTFTSGKLTIGNNTLTISNNAPAAIVGHNVNSYVVTNGTGTLQRAIAIATNSYDFPVGNADFYKLSNINYTTAPTAAGFLSARWNVGYPGWPNLGPLIEPNGVNPDINLISVAYNGSWFLDADINLAGGIYTGTFTGNGDNVVIDYLQTVLVKRPTTPPGQDWTLDGTHVTTTGSNAVHTLSRTGMAGFSEFAISGILNVSLPINLNYLNGFKQNGVHNLVWKVTCTNNPSATMSLERSADNRTFTGITTITADALRCEQPFSFTDNSPLKGTNYYRLKMTDANGKISYSAAIAILNAASGFDIVGLLPTLVNNNAILNVTAAQKTKMDVIVTDIAGKQVQKIAYNLIAGSNQFSMNLSGLAAGTYQITGYTAEGKSKTIRFVKQ